MAEKPLNAYEIALLESSPHVIEVVKNKIYYTPEFKKVMYGGLVSGKRLRMILEENGIPPKILGQNRLHNIAAALRRNGTREEGFVDARMLGIRNMREQCFLTAAVQNIKRLIASLLSALVYFKPCILY